MRYAHELPLFWETAAGIENKNYEDKSYKKRSVPDEDIVQRDWGMIIHVVDIVI